MHIKTLQFLCGSLLALLALAGCSPEDEVPGSPAKNPLYEQDSVSPSSDSSRNDASGEPSSRDAAVANLGIIEPYKGKLTSLSLINVRDAKLERVLPPIEYPWAFEFIDSNEILLTQNNGTLLRINLTNGDRSKILGLPEIGSGFDQIGLMDVELHPDFASNGRIYLSFAKPNPGATKYHMTEVATGILRGNEITELQTLINGDHYGWAPSNFGGALAFDDENHLYISIGDRGNESSSLEGDRLEGKILRLHDDGSIPDDNPFVGQEGYDPRVYAIGVRNTQGLFFDAQTRQLFEVEHGPLGGDEVNIIEAGKNYGWPKISYGNNYSSGKPVGVGTHLEGIEQPLFYFLPSIATSKLIVYRGDMFKEWEGDIFIGALKAQHVAKLDFDAGVVRSSQPILDEVKGRIRDIKLAPDGSIYILSQTSGLHRLFREAMVTEKAAASGKQDKVSANSDNVRKSGPHPGQQYYDLVCSGCHDDGSMGAPVLGNYDQWKSIIEQPLELTREHVMDGYNDMPERGLCYSCSEYGLMQIVDYMFEQASQ